MIAFQVREALTNSGLGLSGFRWQDLLEGSKVVDVGGGVGDSSMLILQANPNLNIVVQDRPSVVSDAQVVYMFEFLFVV